MPSVTPRHQVRSGHLLQHQEVCPPPLRQWGIPERTSTPAPPPVAPGVVHFPGERYGTRLFRIGLLAFPCRCDICHNAPGESGKRALGKEDGDLLPTLGTWSTSSV
jgi:hypothetical protein